MSASYGIVLGCPRSGTKYLMSVLGTIPDFECVSGTLLPVAVPHAVNHDPAPDIYDALATGFERALDMYLHSGRYHSRAAALQKWTRAPSGLGALWKALRGKRPLPERLIYKEPFLGFAPQFVLDALPPDTPIVHAVRDGRDCARSLVENYDVLTDEKLAHLRSAEVCMGRRQDHRYVPWWVGEGHEKTFLGSSPYVRATWMWKEIVRRCHGCFSSLEAPDRDRVMRVRYEDFVRAPAEQGAALLDHFGAAPTAATRRRLEQAHTRSIGTHRQQPSRDVRAAERVAGDELALYNYDVRTRPDPPSPLHAN